MKRSIIPIVLLSGAVMSANEAFGAIDAAAAARLPAPGTVTPGSFAFAPDGKSLTYLKSESGDLRRVLWRVEIRGEGDAGKPRIVARPPGAGDTDASVSKEEALRRERQRLRETGITQVVRASKADVSIIPLNSDLYLQRGDAPLERITNTPAPEIDPKLNADGTMVAFVRERELFVIELGSKTETKLTEGAVEGVSRGLAEFIAQEEMDRTSGFWWSPDSTRIAFQETDERHIPLFSIVHEAAADRSVETHRYPFSGKPNAKVRLGVVSTRGGPVKWLEFNDPGEDVYLARLQWRDPKSVFVQVLSRDQTSLKLIAIDVESGERRLLLEERSKTWVNLHDDPTPTGKAGAFLWTAERTGYRHIELRNAEGGLVRALTSGEWAVDSIAAFDAVRGEVWFQANREHPAERHVYRVSIEGGPIERISTEPGTHVVTVADRGDTYVDVWSNGSTPPRTLLRDRDGSTLKVLDDANSDPRLAEYRPTPPEFLEFAGKDGVRFLGAYYAPRSKALASADGKSPLIVMLYGGPHVQYVSDDWKLSADMRAQLLAERGFAVWKMDNRGAARRGHVFEAPLHRKMGVIEVLDQVDGVRFIAGRKPEVDPTRVGVNGRSYGGYMTLRCLTEAPETFHAGVAEAPVTDWDGYDTCYTERYMGTPENNPDGYKRSSVLHGIGKLKGRLLLMHGLIDENVHFRHTARLIDALVEHGKPFEVLPMPEERHSSRKPQRRTYELERLVGFLESALAARHP